MAFRNLAVARFPGASIEGCGRFAIQDESGAVHLYITIQEAKRWTAFYDRRVIDLAAGQITEEILNSIPDRMDADERRRERRSRA